MDNINEDIWHIVTTLQTNTIATHLKTIAIQGTDTICDTQLQLRNITIPKA